MKKLSLSNAIGALSRNEMKMIMAGSGDSTVWNKCCNSSGTSCSPCGTGAICLDNLTLFCC